MEDVFLTARIDENRTVCISPLPSRTYRETQAKGLGGELGYFVYEVDSSRPSAGIEIIAKAASLEAAFRLFEIISRSLNLDRSDGSELSLA